MHSNVRGSLHFTMTLHHIARDKMFTYVTAILELHVKTTQQRELESTKFNGNWKYLRVFNHFTLDDFK